ncbi:hypothetical protein SKAU_G00111350 [Synaphobranchus kaupii]|uniref:Transmembrane protein 52 n=1 Tax=Synaphobranchus kaupii TaxID=118154 RepID=A0A9Q1G160_SYNKA|nr:hypothetical protein SKAU_G00111350 [Synaphobranchus kaupii]
MKSVEVLITFLVLLVSFTVADENCIKDCWSEFDPSSLWYVWVILVFVFALFGCGLIASCIKMCCRPNKPPVSMVEGHPLEVTVISMDNQSTVHSISRVSSFTDSHPLRPFMTAVDNRFSPPPYNLYTLDSLPQYDEALAMPTNELAGIGGTAEDHGGFQQTSASEGESVEFTQETLHGEDLQDARDSVVLEEEEPPAYQPYGVMAEEQFNEIDLNELDPAESHKEDTNTHEQNV